MTTVVGITGGIGSGKSTFSREVKNRGLSLLDSDLQVANLYEKPTKQFIKHLRNIGLAISIKNKKINKNLISNEVFSNKKIKSKLENFIFKVIRIDRKNFIKKEKQKKTKIIFLDVPLLFENNLNGQFDIIISIISPRETRYRRLKKTKNLSKKLFDKILKAQTSDIERKEKSDIIILNNKSKKEYLKKINQVLDKIVL